MRNTMIALVFRIALVGASLASQVVPVVADSPPTLNIDPSCSAAIAFKRTKEMCMDAERATLALLTKNWSLYSSANKTVCVGMTSHGGPQSYIELITCLDSMRDADAIHKDQHTDGTVSESTERKSIKSISKPKPQMSGAASTAHSGAAPEALNPNSSNQDSGNPLNAVVRWLSGVFKKN
jgi:hypothetical protein